MRWWLYTLGVRLYGAAIRLASLWNAKAKQWVQGRRGWEAKISQLRKPGETWVWFHAASLGEFEQGRNLIEAWAQEYPSHKILLTFFSPSGFEVRKDYKGAHCISYLPLDTPANARRFLGLVNPHMAFFIKYEIWAHYLTQMKQMQIPVYLVSSLVRPGSRFLSGFLAPVFKEAFLSFAHIFTQNEETKKLIQQATGSAAVTVAGDTRFDRVLKVKTTFEPVAGLAAFQGTDFCIVCGSTWPQDEEIILSLVREWSDKPLKWVIAPHEIHEKEIEKQVKAAPELHLRFSQRAQLKSSHRVLWIDNIGMLSRLYFYGDLAYVGGAFGKGVHNTLEPAVFGNPVFFGPRYQHSDETVEMIALGTAYTVQSLDELRQGMEQLMNDGETLAALRQRNEQYVQSRSGATSLILQAVKDVGQ